MLEGRLFVKLTTCLGNVSASEFICDVVTYFEGGKVLAYDKFTESSTFLRVGNVDLTLVGGSGNLVKVDLLVDNCNPLDGFSYLVNTFNKVLSQKSTARAEVKSIELISGYETYIPLTRVLTYKPTHIAKVLSNYGVLVQNILSESIDGTGLLSVLGEYVVGGLGVVRIVYTALVRNYSVRSSLSMGKRVSRQEVREDLIKKLVYESYLLAQVVNDGLYTRYGC